MLKMKSENSQRDNMIAYLNARVTILEKVVEELRQKRLGDMVSPTTGKSIMEKIFHFRVLDVDRKFWEGFIAGLYLR
jgi:hypothetical protein